MFLQLTLCHTKCFQKLKIRFSSLRELKTRTLTVGQNTSNGSEVEAVVTSNRGGLGPVTHSFPPSHQGGRGTTIEQQPLPCQQPTKEVYLTPTTTTPKEFQTTWCFGKDWQHAGLATFNQQLCSLESCHSVTLESTFC